MNKHIKVSIFILFLSMIYMPAFSQQFNYWPASDFTALNFNTEPPFLDNCGGSISFFGLLGGGLHPFAIVLVMYCFMLPVFILLIIICITS